MSWKIISPDLTRNDKSKQTASGGPLTKDITSVEYYDTIFALAESPLRKGKLWVGTDDGLVQMTEDDGAHWHNVTPKEMPAWSTVSMTEPSHFDAASAYIAVDRHRLDDIAPYAWKTADNGKTWTAISAGLPPGAVVHVVREDPVRRGLLYAGTELGRIRLLRRRRALAAAAERTAGHADPRPGRARRRPGCRDPRARVLDSRRPDAAAPGARPAHRLPVLYTPETRAAARYYPDEVNSRRPVGENPPAGAIIDYVLDGRRDRLS